MLDTKKYEVTIFLRPEFNKSQLKAWVINYSRNLRKFNVGNISVISRGKQKLSYPIRDQIKANYIQFNFSSMPKYLNLFLEILKIDPNVLRVLVLKSKIN